MESRTQLVVVLRFVIVVRLGTDRLNRTDGEAIVVKSQDQRRALLEVRQLRRLAVERDDRFGGDGEGLLDRLAFVRVFAAEHELAAIGIDFEQLTFDERVLSRFNFNRIEQFAVSTELQRNLHPQLEITASDGTPLADPKQHREAQWISFCQAIFASAEFRTLQ